MFDICKQTSSFSYLFFIYTNYRKKYKQKINIFHILLTTSWMIHTDSHKSTSHQFWQYFQILSNIKQIIKFDKRVNNKFILNVFNLIIYFSFIINWYNNINMPVQFIGMLKYFFNRFIQFYNKTEIYIKNTAALSTGPIKYYRYI